MMNENIDSWLDKIPTKIPSNGLAERIVHFATAHPQHHSCPNQLKRLLLCLVTPFPLDLPQKAAVMGVIAIMMFSIGTLQSYLNQDIQDETMISFLSADLDDVEFI